MGSCIPSFFTCIKLNNDDPAWKGIQGKSKMTKGVVKNEQPKPNLRIRIPPPRSDEEILRSPIKTPVSPQPFAYLQVQDWIKGSGLWVKF
jgi:hypothetical protein